MDSQVKATKADYTTKKVALEKKMNAVKLQLQKVQGHLDNSEHTILSHVLTLMGVFTAVTTIIMSVVITSSSWLNNGDGASAILAFAIPNAIAILAVIVLVSLMFVYQKSFTNNSKGRKGPIVFFLGLFIAILLLCITLAWAAISYVQPRKPTQIRYVISPAEYTIVEEIDDISGKTESFYQFVFDGVNYKFLYDEKYMHDKNLYFCPEHKVIE